MKVHVNNGHVETAVRRVDAENVVKTLIDLMEDFLLEWGLVGGAGISLLILGLSIWRDHGLSFSYFKRIPQEK